MNDTQATRLIKALEAIVEELKQINQTLDRTLNKD